MINIFNNRGKGCGNGPIQYLLGKNFDRKHAKVLRGNPEITRDLIDSLNFAKKYTSGTLSFEEVNIDEKKSIK